MRALSTRQRRPRHSQPFDKDARTLRRLRRRRQSSSSKSSSLQSPRRKDPRRKSFATVSLILPDALPHDRIAPRSECCYPSQNHGSRSPGISPDQSTYLNAHATSTPLATPRVQGHRKPFGERAPQPQAPRQLTKSMTGHLLGGARRPRSRHHIMPCWNNRTPD